MLKVNCSTIAAINSNLLSFFGKELHIAFVLYFIAAVFALERDFASLYTLWGELSQNQLTNASVLSLPGETLKTDWRN